MYRTCGPSAFTAGFRNTAVDFPSRRKLEKPDRDSAFDIGGARYSYDRVTYYHENRPRFP